MEQIQCSLTLSEESGVTQPNVLLKVGHVTCAIKHVTCTVKHVTRVSSYFSCSCWKDGFAEFFFLLHPPYFMFVFASQSTFLRH